MRVTMGSRTAPCVRQTMERRARAAANMQKLAEAREAHVGEVEYELRVAREDVAELRARLTQPRAAGDRNGDPGAAAGHPERGGGGGDARGGGGAPDGARRPPDEPPAVEDEAAGAAAGGLGEGALALSARCAASTTDYRFSDGSCPPYHAVQRRNAPAHCAVVAAGRRSRQLSAPMGATPDPKQCRVG